MDTYEKKYKEALEWARKVMQGKVGFVLDDVLEKFPELESERVRESLLKYLHTLPNHYSHSGVCAPKWIAWLEKQGEQKPWSEEDERCLENAIMYCEWARDKAPDVDCYETSERSINWLNSFKDKVQPKQEWSEEDEAHLHSLITHLEQWIKKHPNTTGADVQGENIAWLKSLKYRATSGRC